MEVIVVQNNAILNDKKANFDKVEGMLSDYIGKDKDIIVLPEVWATGWSCVDFVKQAEEGEQGKDSLILEFLKSLAKKHNSMIIGGSYIRKIGDEYRNTMPVISKRGEIIALYDKMHLFTHPGSEEQKYISKGNEPVILDLGYTKIGLTVCYDIRFPEVYREYSKRGVEVFVNVAAWGSKKLMHWEIMHKARAIENQCYMIVADQTGVIKDDEYNLGHSMVISPWGDVVAGLEAEESCISAKLDFENLRKLRKEFPLLNDRRYDTLNIKEVLVYE